jgi:radical SAM superfamily enzyme YgiQ (UPF0313 family)
MEGITMYQSGTSQMPIRNRGCSCGCCGCECGTLNRRFISRKEELDSLKEYKEEIVRELAGVEERMLELDID